MMPLLLLLLLPCPTLPSPPGVIVVDHLSASTLATTHPLPPHHDEYTRQPPLIQPPSPLHKLRIVRNWETRMCPAALLVR